ncbi:MAG: putative minor capsid protein [Coprococcus phoceensis]|nr:MAG TPA: Minor capsid protein [Caudoviricetes sp.]
MVAIRAIPKSLLNHTVTHAKIKDADRWGTEQITNNKTVKNVRLEPSTKVVRDKNNAEVQLAATLFYDCKNSSPRGVVFKTDDIIIFNGEMFKVQTIEPLYDARKLHHFELGMIRHG